MKRGTRRARRKRVSAEQTLLFVSMCVRVCVLTRAGLCVCVCVCIVDASMENLFDHPDESAEASEADMLGELADLSMKVIDCFICFARLCPNIYLWLYLCGLQGDSETEKREDGTPDVKRWRNKTDLLRCGSI